MPSSPPARPCATWLPPAWARGFGLRVLGPDAVERGRRETVGRRGAWPGRGRSSRAPRRPAYDALIVIGVQRLGYGVTTVVRAAAVPELLPQTTACCAPAPAAWRSWSPRWRSAAALPRSSPRRRCGALGRRSLAGALLDRWGPSFRSPSVLSYRLPLVLSGAVLVGLCSQGIKITVDTIVQRASTTSSAVGCSPSTTPCSTSRSWSPPCSPPWCCPRTGAPRVGARHRGRLRAGWRVVPAPLPDGGAQLIVASPAAQLD